MISYTTSTPQTTIENTPRGQAFRLRHRYIRSYPASRRSAILLDPKRQVSNQAPEGESIEENLWIACPLCNGHKATKTHVVDPLTESVVPLFNPRTQDWYEHFSWSEDGVYIVGKTAIGRATTESLQLNNKYLLRARRRWVIVGWHPPQD